jgi:hypothetical protein
MGVFKGRSPFAIMGVFKGRSPFALIGVFKGHSPLSRSGAGCPRQSSVCPIGKTPLRIGRMSPVRLCSAADP